MLKRLIIRDIYNFTILKLHITVIVGRKNFNEFCKQFLVRFICDIILRSNVSL